MRQSKIQKREIIVSIFFIQSRRFGGLFPPLLSAGFSVVSVENEKLDNIVTDSKIGDRGECHIVFPSLIFQNHEEGNNKPPKRRL